MADYIRPAVAMRVEALRDFALGYQGEKRAQEIRIDVGQWLDAWPDAEIRLMLQRPGERTAYPAAQVRREGQVLAFTPGQEDTALTGMDGRAYLIALRGEEQLGKSRTVLTRVYPSGSGMEGETPPEAGAGYVEQVLQAANRAQAAAEKAESMLAPDAIRDAVEDYLEENPPDGVPEDAINQAVESALEAAKESGDFDGPPGPPGAQGPQGPQGPPGQDAAETEPKVIASVTVDEEVSEVYIPLDAEGKPLNLVDMRVEIVCPVYSEGDAVFVWYANNMPMWYHPLIFKATESMRSYMRAIVNHGRISVVEYGYAPVSKFGQSERGLLYGNALWKLDYDKIDSFRIVRVRENGVIPAGTVITITGRKADA